MPFTISENCKLKVKVFAIPVFFIYDLIFHYFSIQCFTCNLCINDPAGAVYDHRHV